MREEIKGIYNYLKDDKVREELLTEFIPLKVVEGDILKEVDESIYGNMGYGKQGLRTGEPNSFGKSRYDDTIELIHRWGSTTKTYLEINTTDVVIRGGIRKQDFKLFTDILKSKMREDRLSFLLDK